LSAAFELPVHVSAALVLVRHGESEWVAEGRFQGRRDPPLSTLGERQAELVARRLAEHDGPASLPLPLPAGPPIGIWHSPLARAAATAALISGARRDPVACHALEALTELGQGEWEGLLHAEVSARWPAELAAWRHNPTLAHAPGGESLKAAAERVRGGLAAIVAALAAQSPARTPGTSTAAADEASRRRQPVPGYPESAAVEPPGVQSDPWAVVVAHDGIFRLMLLSLLGVDYGRFWSFPFNLCTISVIGLHEGVPTLRAHNLADHLAPLAAEARALAEARGDRRGAL
jgi:broad specificity phosphatase PhoE